MQKVAIRANQVYRLKRRHRRRRHNLAAFLRRLLRKRG
jgi:hypothetical protein